MSQRFIDCFNHFFPQGIWDKIMSTSGAVADMFGLVPRVSKPTGKSGQGNCTWNIVDLAGACWVRC